MKQPSSIPSLDFHSPAELLANATAMQKSGDEKLFRAAILESITALEAYVQKEVFKSLDGKLDPLLVKWLEEKTKMDFDSRLSVLTPVATGVPVDKQSDLWDAYKKAKDIRNKVVHSGRKVSAGDVNFVIESVRNWLSYLSSTVELEQMLLKLKHWVENQIGLALTLEPQATQLVARYFHQLTKASVILDAEHIATTGTLRSDLILDFDPRKVLVETKLIRDGRNPRIVVESAVAQADLLRKAASIQQACAVVFIKGYSDKVPDIVERHHKGEIFSVLIRVP